MTPNPLQNNMDQLKMTGPNRGSRPDLALEHGKPLGKVRYMPHYRHYPDSAPKIKTGKAVNMAVLP